jgi:predicted double-glycine peptidase
MQMQRNAWALLAVWLAVQPSAGAAEISFCPLPGTRFYGSTESLQERRWKHVVQQALDISCGSAALATIINYQFDDQVAEETIIRTVLANVKADEVRKRGGFSMLDLKRVGAALGYTVKGYKVSFEQLVRLDVPALVPITVRGFKHFVVFRGALEDGRVLLADPSFGNIVLVRDDFDRIWQGIALVLSRGDRDGRGSRLEPVDEDVERMDQPEAFRTFNTRQSFHSVLQPDEF